MTDRDPHAAPLDWDNIDPTMKMIKWARKQGALLIKVNGVELTFPPDVDARISIESHRRTLDTVYREADDIKAEKALRSALSTDALNQIEDQEQWFHNNRPPQI